MAPGAAGSEVAADAAADPHQGPGLDSSDDNVMAAMSLGSAARLLAATRRRHLQALLPVGPR